MKKTFIIIIALAVVAALAFYGGMKYGSSQQIAQPNGAQGGQFGQFRNSSAGNGRSGGSFGGGNAPLIGQIVSKDNASLIIRLSGGNSNGSSKIVLFSSSTSVTKSVNGTPDNLTQGENITVIGKTNSDGSVTAESIQVRPAPHAPPGK